MTTTWRFECNDETLAEWRANTRNPAAIAAQAASLTAMFADAGKLIAESSEGDNELKPSLQALIQYLEEIADRDVAEGPCRDSSFPTTKTGIHSRRQQQS